MLDRENGALQLQMIGQSFMHRGQQEDNDFFGDNWHNNQISTPTNLVHLMLLMGDELPEDLVEEGQPIIGRVHREHGPAATES